MYDREKIEEALEALSLGFSSSQAAELAGVAPSTVEHWSKGRLPLSWDARGARIAVTGHRGEAARMTETRAPVRPAGERPARRPFVRPDREPASRGGVGRPRGAARPWIRCRAGASAS